MTKSKGVIIKDPIKRFWVSLHISNIADGCWEWDGRKSHKGYGIMKIKNHNVQAHRFSYELFNGKIPDGMCVCHKCDNPSCVCPSHLFLGTIKDNNDDRDRKGHKAVGSHNGRSKLTESDVLQIKHLIFSDMSDSEISRLYNVWHSTIRAIRVGITWSHL